MEFDIAEIEKVFPAYKVIDMLGAGATGKVYQLEHREKNTKMALKKINCFGMCDYQKSNAMNQVRLLASLKHPKIIKMESCFIDSDDQSIFILMQLADGKDILELLNQVKQKKKRISQAFIWRILGDLAQGLTYLHQNKIIHRDIKPANIFRVNNTFKLGDMNVSKLLKNENATTQIGSPYYTAPQVWGDDGYNQKCDVWSLGIVIFELCCLKLPFDANSIGELIKKLSSFKLGKIPVGYSFALQEVIEGMLIKDPKKRMSSQQVLQFCHKAGKLRDQKSLQRAKSKDKMMDTMIFPQCQKKWINLAPLPPKICKKQSKLSTSIRKAQQNRDIESGEKSREKSREKSQSHKQNLKTLTNIDNVQQNKSWCGLLNSKLKRQSSNENLKSIIRLPSILKRGESNLEDSPRSRPTSRDSKGASRRDTITSRRKRINFAEKIQQIRKNNQNSTLDN